MGCRIGEKVELELVVKKILFVDRYGIFYLKRVIKNSVARVGIKNAGFYQGAIEPSGE